MRRVRWTKTLKPAPTALAGQGIGQIKAGEEALLSDELADLVIKGELAVMLAPAGPAVVAATDKPAEPVKAAEPEGEPKGEPKARKVRDLDGLAHR